MDLVDTAIEQGLPEQSTLLSLIHQAGGEFDLQSLLEEHVMSWEPESRPEAAEVVANWLESVAAVFRRGSQDLLLELKHREQPITR